MPGPNLSKQGRPHHYSNHHHQPEREVNVLKNAAARSPRRPRDRSPPGRSPAPEPQSIRSPVAPYLNQEHSHMSRKTISRKTLPAVAALLAAGALASAAVASS